ncbi:MAG: hypothetical protein IT385_18155 [Deltaproteobacteria bacterium]|nr:hypothetical protein [Deltaproteobacteria bacterium]
MTDRPPPAPSPLPSSPPLVRLRRSASAAAAALALGAAPGCIDSAGEKKDAADAATEVGDTATTDTFIAPQPPPQDTLEGPDDADTEAPDFVAPQPPPDTTQAFDAIPPQPPPQQPPRER